MVEVRAEILANLTALWSLLDAPADEWRVVDAPAPGRNRSRCSCGCHPRDDQGQRTVRRGCDATSVTPKRDAHGYVVVGELSSDEVQILDLGEGRAAWFEMLRGGSGVDVALVR